MIAFRSFDDGEMLRLYRNFEELGLDPSLTIPGAPHCGFKVIVPGDKHADWADTVADALKCVWPDRMIVKRCRRQNGDALQDRRLRT